MVQTIYNCTNCGREETHEQSALEDIADVAPHYDGMEKCPESKYADDPHHYGLTKVLNDDDEEVPLYDILWLRENTFVEA